LVKDNETFGTNQFTRVHLLDQGNFFPSITANELTNKAKA